MSMIKIKAHFIDLLLITFIINVYSDCPMLKLSPLMNGAANPCTMKILETLLRLLMLEAWYGNPRGH